MKIILKGDLGELFSLGLKEGDEINAYQPAGSTSGVLHFSRSYHGFTHNCSVWPENHDVVENKNNEAHEA